MTSKRVRFLQELIAFVGLAGRLRLEWISSAEANKFVKVVSEFTEQIRQLGPSPLVRSSQTRTALERAPGLGAAVGSGHVCGCSVSATPA